MTVKELAQYLLDNFDHNLEIYTEEAGSNGTWWFPLQKDKIFKLETNRNKAITTKKESSHKTPEHFIGINY